MRDTQCDGRMRHRNALVRISSCRVLFVGSRCAALRMHIDMSDDTKADQLDIHGLEFHEFVCSSLHYLSSQPQI